MATSRRCRSVPGGLVVAVFTLAACGAPASSGPAPSVDDAVPAGAWSGYVDPIAAAEFNFMTPGEIANMMESEVAACMSRRGLEYTARHDGVGEPLTRSGARTYRIQHGFEAEAGHLREHPNEAYMRSMTLDELRRYLDVLEGPSTTEGTSTGGCRAEAEAIVAESVPFFQERRNEAVARAYAQVMTSRQMQAALSDYASCMKSAGFVTGDPALVLDEAARIPGDAAHTLAVADLDCQSTTTWPVWDTFYPPDTR